MSAYEGFRRLLGDAGPRPWFRFSEVEDEVGSELPESAWKHRAWWANDDHHVQAAKGWLAAGYEVAHVDRVAEIVCFQDGRGDELR